jgi:hypothetical protein
VGRRGALVAGFPVRLPAGWVPLAPVEGSQVAVLPNGDGERPTGVLTVTSVAAGDPLDDAVDRLRSARPGLLLLDEGPVRCRGDRPAHRVLTAHVQHGRSMTTELWLVAGEPAALLCATVDTACYAALYPVIQRTLRSYRQ